MAQFRAGSSLTAAREDRKLVPPWAESTPRRLGAKNKIYVYTLSLKMTTSRSRLSFVLPNVSWQIAFFVIRRF